MYFSFLPGDRNLLKSRFNIEFFLESTLEGALFIRLAIISLVVGILRSSVSVGMSVRKLSASAARYVLDRYDRVSVFDPRWDRFWTGLPLCDRFDFFDPLQRLPVLKGRVLIYT